MAQVTEMPNRNWKQQLQKNDRGKNLSNAFNVLLILNNDENLKGKIAFNTLTKRIEIIGSVPWKRITKDKTITDHDDSCLRNYLSVRYNIKAKDIIFDAANQVAAENAYHPVRNYLKEVYQKWDGKPRLDTLLIDFFGADDTELNRWQTRLTFVGAVQRAFEAGSKMDYVLTLKGDQGLGKSTFFQTIAVKPEWFTDSLDEIKGKDAKELIRGNWIVELGEMAAVRKGDQKRLKQFITSTEDEFRESYGRRTNRYPRQCIFVATTNDDMPLKDDTGGRRWWIVEVKKKWFEHNAPLEVDQIWAEAVHVYRERKENNETLQLPDHLEKAARRMQSENTDKGVYAAEIEYILQRGYIERRDYQTNNIRRIPINETCARHVWEEILGRSYTEFTSATGRAINAVLKNLDGWQPSKERRQFKEYGKQTVYTRTDKTDR